MLSEKQLEDLKYLRSLDRIIIPSEFTYWCHSTMYKPASDCVTLSDKRCWNEIPTDNFTIKREMSFVSRTQRLDSALDYGGRPSTTYANTAGSLPFQIRVLQPKHDFVKELYEKEEDVRRHYFCERGLGDGRHPKLPGKTDVYVINFATKDDVSDSLIDIVYCVTAEDISIVADLVRKIVNENNIEYNTNIQIVNNRAKENNVPTVIERCKDKRRFFDLKLRNGNDAYLVKEAGYKEDYKKMKTSKR